MKKKFDRRNLSFPPGLIPHVQKVLRPTESLSHVVSEYLVSFVARRRDATRK